MPAVQSTASDLDVDLGRLFSSLVERWRRIAAVVLGVTALALLYAWTATPSYRAETRILIETRESIFTRPQANAESDRPILDEEGVTSQVEVIASTDLLKQVALKLNLARLPEFDDAADLSMLSRLLIIAGLKSDPNEMPPEERVLTAFREKLTVYRVEKSRVIVIQMSSEDPKLAAEIPNALAEAYLAVQSAAKLQSNSDATDWLSDEIKNLTSQVKEAEARVAAFRGESDLLVGQNNAVLATQQLSELSSELSRVRASRAAADANAKSVRGILDSGGSLDALPEVLNSNLIQRLRERQVQLKADIADLSTTLLDNHPRIRGLRSQLSDLDGQIRTEAQNVLKGFVSEAKTAQLREEQLFADLNTLKAESARAGEQEVELRALEREANAQRELLESYLTRYREAASRRDGNYLPADARIFSKAVTPSEPYYPKVVPLAGAAFVGSLLLMMVVTLLQELFSGRAMRPAPNVQLDPISEVVIPVNEPVLVVAEAEEMRPSGDARNADLSVVGSQVAAAELEQAAGNANELVETETVEIETGPTESASVEVTAATAAMPEPKPQPALRRESAALAAIREAARRIMPERAAQTVQPELAPEAPAAAAPVGEPDAPGTETPIDETGTDEMRYQNKPRSVLGEIDIESAAEQLIARGVTRAIFISPEGDEAAAAAVLVAREIADAGLRVLLLDLTASGAASMPMLESLDFRGITNLLASEAQFTDVIHQDNFSDCHVIPVGTADPARAMRAADRLPIIMDSLTTAYDIVLVECGPADADGIRRLATDNAEIMISVIEPDEDIEVAAAQLRAGGYRRLTLVTPVGHVVPPPPQRGRSAA